MSLVSERLPSNSSDIDMTLGTTLCVLVIVYCTVLVCIGVRVQTFKFSNSGFQNRRLVSQASEETPVCQIWMRFFAGPRSFVTVLASSASSKAVLRPVVPSVLVSSTNTCLCLIPSLRLPLLTAKPPISTSSSTTLWMHTRNAPRKTYLHTPSSPRSSRATHPVLFLPSFRNKFRA